MYVYVVSTISLGNHTNHTHIISQNPTGSNATGAFVLLRLYAYDKLSKNKTDMWGAVPPPAVRYKVWFGLCGDRPIEGRAVGGL